MVRAWQWSNPKQLGPCVCEWLCWAWRAHEQRMPSGHRGGRAVRREVLVAVRGRLRTVAYISTAAGACISAGAMRPGLACGFQWP